MRIYDIVKEADNQEREPDHKVGVGKLSFDEMQATISQLRADRGWQNLERSIGNDWVAVLGAVGHAMGQGGGVRGKPQMQEPDSDTSASIDIVRYNDPRIAGSYTPSTGVVAVADEVMDRVINDATGAAKGFLSNTIYHEHLHRGFGLISKTPELWKWMPEDIKNYWSETFETSSSLKYQIANVQISPEHAMIYSATESGSRFEYTLDNEYNIDWYVFCDNLRKEVQIGSSEDPTPLWTLVENRILYLVPQAVTEERSPVFGMKPKELLAYWRKLYELVNEGIKSFFTQIGPPRRWGKRTSSGKVSAHNLKTKITNEIKAVIEEVENNPTMRRTSDRSQVAYLEGEFKEVVKRVLLNEYGIEWRNFKSRGITRAKISFIAMKVVANLEVLPGESPLDDPEVLKLINELINVLLDGIKKQNT